MVDLWANGHLLQWYCWRRRLEVSVEEKIVEDSHSLDWHDELGRARLGELGPVCVFP